MSTTVYVNTCLNLLFTGIYISSTELVTIHIATYVTTANNYDQYTPDSVLARPVSHSALEYVLAGYDFEEPGSAYPK